MKKLFVTIALGATMAATLALAQERGNWASHDQTRQHAQQRHATMFDMLDANKDGTVTKAEADHAEANFLAARGGDSGRGGGRMGRMLEQAFASSPSITRQQFEAQALTRFDAMDLNHDGTASVAEQ